MELRCCCCRLIKDLATASLPEYVATHSHQTDYLAPFRTRHLTRTGNTNWSRKLHQNTLLSETHAQRSLMFIWATDSSKFFLHCPCQNFTWSDMPAEQSRVCFGRLHVGLSRGEQKGPFFRPHTNSARILAVLREISYSYNVPHL